jgi:glutamate carboxypeptidase
MYIRGFSSRNFRTPLCPSAQIYGNLVAMQDALLNWIDTQHHRMVSLVTRWCNINSGSRNLPGLATMLAELKTAFAPLDGEMKKIAVPPETVIDNTGHAVAMPLGNALSIRKRPAAPTQVFLCIHMDTVYGPDHTLQTVRQIDARTLNGPGVADAKGGICVMLLALEAFEKTEAAKNIGWEVLLTADEELGSPGSAALLTESARRNQLGLIFEPAHADGALVGERKGSGNFTFVIHGKSAHAGRDFHQGRNAIHAAARLVTALDDINRSHLGVTVNTGRIDGGGPTNIVPDLAIIRSNIRIPAHLHRQQIEADLLRIVEVANQTDGITVEMTGGFNSPPRPMDLATTRLYEKLAECGRQINLPITWHASGGVSDANKLAAAGLPVIDTLGPCGGDLHSAEEFLLTDTLAQRAKLVALFLQSLA